jgi:hypothetical protein
VLNVNGTSGERYELKFKTELFNLANTPHLTIPAANMSVTGSSFMQAPGLQNIGRDGINQRQFRFGLHLAF